MNAQRKAPQNRRTQKHTTLIEALRQFLTPQVWKQAHQADPRRHHAVRWTIQPLLLGLLVMTWAAGDSQAERFETARAFVLSCRPKRRRPGQTLAGWEKAVARLPMPVLRSLAAGVRRQILRWFLSSLELQGFIPIGCDGSRADCPRTAELERFLGQAGKPQTTPQIWITALVLLGNGVLWAWRLGKGTASEIHHLEHLVRTLPRKALVVADAAFRSYRLFQAVLLAQASFLFRVSSKVDLYTVTETALKQFEEGLVYYWPKWTQEKGMAPIPARLIRVRSRKGKHDVWLLTNVLESRALTAETAGRVYRLRWENECFFRTFKRTFRKVKLVSETVRMVHREAEGALVAVQLVTAQGALALLASGQAKALSSPRKVVLEIRRELNALPKPRPKQGYGKRLESATRERRERTSGKVKRQWPRRKEHKAPKPPQILTLSCEQKARISQLGMAI